MYLVVSCSLNAESRSRTLAQAAASALREVGAEAEVFDLRDTPLPLCDGDACYDIENVRAASQRVRAAEGVLLAAPIYNYDVNAAAKNLIELTGDAWEEKVVGFLCAAGGRSSYMSVMGLANSLMLDFRSFILPRFVYASGGGVNDDGTLSAEIQERVRGLGAELIRVATALRRK